MKEPHKNPCKSWTALRIFTEQAKVATEHMNAHHEQLKHIGGGSVMVSINAEFRAIGLPEYERWEFVLWYENWQDAIERIEDRRVASPKRLIIRWRNYRRKLKLSRCRKASDSSCNH